MNEIHRVLAPGGWLLARAPSPPVTLDTFRTFTQRWRAEATPGIASCFQGARIWEESSFAYADLVALKGQVLPGPVDI